ncbi:DUF2971 domain-containing protein [Arenibacterium halophilum]|uniref:DUF2971 domain-containing protein n=1 Tax=Arenibacterium halophilum TaxID=2583821 RepID=A0ABY2X7L3_9RHOB|nr:DUF2971 domain-containing protein [Arenibacterium halophilum]TMV11779.1 DUF2971 domain-containing protein [Arenibacterium halophilum]
MKNTIRVYHFICDHWAAENVRNSRLKLSFSDNVNDLFELMPFDFGYDEDARVRRKAWKCARAKHSVSQGFISFSENWNVPTMWAHYADNHKGVCLGFDLPLNRNDGTPYATKIKYVDRLYPMDARILTDETYNREMVKIASETKSNHWSYEKEWRFWFSLSGAERDLKNANSNQLIFADFDENLALKEVIFGVKSSHTTDGFKALLDQPDEVKFTTARPSFRRFEMVPQLRPSLQK